MRTEKLSIVREREIKQQKCNLKCFFFSRYNFVWCVERPECCCFFVGSFKRLQGDLTFMNVCRSSFFRQEWLVVVIILLLPHFCEQFFFLPPPPPPLLVLVLVLYFLLACFNFSRINLFLFAFLCASSLVPLFFTINQHHFSIFFLHSNVNLRLTHSTIG